MTDYEIVITSPRAQLRISPDCACKLMAGGISGFDAAGADVELEPYAMLQGGSVTKRRFRERELSVTFEIGAERDAAEKIRREIISIMDPRSDVELTLRSGELSRRITVIPYKEARFKRGLPGEYTVVTLTFVAADVFFTDTEAVTVRFRETAPMLTFPMSFMAGSGTVAGYHRISDKADVENFGDGDCGITARIRAVGGRVVCPEIRCGEKFIKTAVTLEDGDLLTVDTRDKRKCIRKNGERTFAFDRDSAFFRLPRGASRVSVSADSGAEFMVAEIEFAPIYFGA